MVRVDHWTRQAWLEPTFEGTGLVWRMEIIGRYNGSAIDVIWSATVRRR